MKDCTRNNFCYFYKDFVFTVRVHSGKLPAL